MQKKLLFTLSEIKEIDELSKNTFKQYSSYRLIRLSNSTNRLTYVVEDEILNSIVSTYEIWKIDTGITLGTMHIKDTNNSYQIFDIAFILKKIDNYLIAKENK